MSRELPPLLSLIAFEAAVRHLSFKAAAEELCLTPSAVSHRIKGLEEFLAVPLFHRFNRSLNLTDAGVAYHTIVRRSLDQIRQATKDTATAGLTEQLNVLCATSLATKWLLKRLPRFLDKHSHINISLNGIEGPINFNKTIADIAICHEPPTQRDVKVESLLVEQYFPMCSPGLGRRIRGKTVAEKLETQTIIHSVRNLVSWSNWLEANGLADLRIHRSLSFDPSAIAIDAAVDGLGIIFESNILAGEELRSRKLKRAFDPKEAKDLDLHYYIATPASTANQSKVETFVGWLHEEARRDNGLPQTST